MRQALLSVAAPLRGRLGVLGLQLLDVLADGEGVEVDDSSSSSLAQ